MKILQIHKYFSKKRGGGSVTAFFELITFLKKMGHEVVIFSMKDEGNEKTEWDKYFISHFDLSKKNSFWQNLKLAPKVICNFEAQKKLEELIEKEKPDIAHVHNIEYYLTPAIFHTLKKKKVPIVMTLHNYNIICPNYKLFTEGKICERCRGGKYYNCLLHKCLKNSYPASFLAMLEAYVHKFKKSYEKVDLFLAPSVFMKNKCEEFGVPENKIKVLRNLINIDTYTVPEVFEESNYFIYYGRLSEEKGITDLIKAVKKLADEKKLGGNRLLIVGKGPQEEYLKKLTQELRLKKEVEFLGFQQGKALMNLISKSKFVVVSSVWYENSPMVIFESQLQKKPIIVSDKGGSKESIIDKKTGFIFNGGNANDLAIKIFEMLNLSLTERKEMGSLGRENIEKIAKESVLFSDLLKVYKDLTK